MNKGSFEPEGLATSAAPHRLMDGTYVQLMHRKGDADPVLVVFGDEVNGPRGRAAGPMGLDADPEAELFEILPKGLHWYPVSETGPLADRLARDGDDGRRAIALGASMGGYGALRYGARAGCSTVLAFGPQARLSPGMTGAGARYSGHYRAEHHADMDIMPAHLPERAFVVIDPAEPHDLLHAELLRHEAGVDVIAMPHMGHRTDMALSSPDTVDAVLEAASSGQREALARALRRGRRRVPAYLARLSRACTQARHPRWGADIAKLPESRGEALEPDLKLALAAARAASGQPLRALEQIEAVIVEAPKVLRFWRILVEQYEAMGQTDAAADVLELALGETENFQFCWKLIQNRIAAGAHVEAGLLVDLALEIWPDRADQMYRVKARIASIGPSGS